MLRLDIDLLRERAQSLGDVTHEEIAARAGIDRSSVSRLFAGSLPSLPTATALAWAYEIQLDELVLKTTGTIPAQVPA